MHLPAAGSRATHDAMYTDDVQARASSSLPRNSVLFSVEEGRPRSFITCVYTAHHSPGEVLDDHSDFSKNPMLHLL